MGARVTTDRVTARVDSSTPEGRLWNWLADNWERTARSNNAQAERIRAVQDLIAQAQRYGVDTVSTGDLLVAIGMDRWYEFPKVEDDD